jgi:hypothetical protein
MKLNMPKSIRSPLTLRVKKLFAIGGGGTTLETIQEPTKLKDHNASSEENSSDQTIDNKGKIT